MATSQWRRALRAAPAPPGGRQAGGSGGGEAAGDHRAAARERATSSAAAARRRWRPRPPHRPGRRWPPGRPPLRGGRRARRQRSSPAAARARPARQPRRRRAAAPRPVPRRAARRRSSRRRTTSSVRVRAGSPADDNGTGRRSGRPSGRRADTPAPGHGPDGRARAATAASVPSACSRAAASRASASAPAAGRGDQPIDRARWRPPACRPAACLARVPTGDGVPGVRLLDDDGGDELVAVARHGADEPRLPRVVVEGAAQRAHRLGQGAVGDDDVAPHHGEDVGLGHRVGAPLDEQPEHVEILAG